jgi:hypothetical protein
MTKGKSEKHEDRGDEGGRLEDALASVTIQRDMS